MNIEPVCGCNVGPHHAECRHGEADQSSNDGNAGLQSNQAIAAGCVVVSGHCWALEDGAVDVPENGIGNMAGQRTLLSRRNHTDDVVAGTALVVASQEVLHVFQRHAFATFCRGLHFASNIITLY